MRKIKSPQLRLIILCSFITLSLLACISKPSIVNALDGVPNQDVSHCLKDITINIKNTSNNTSIVTNNSVIGSLYNGEHYKVTINWKIEADDYENHIEPGDYFIINLDNNYFSFKDSNQEYNLVYLGYTIGKWKIENRQVKCTFTEQCQQFMEVSGFFEASGHFISESRATNTVTIGDVRLDIPMNPTTTGFPYKDSPSLSWDYGLLSKRGNHYANNTYMSWYIYGNYENAQKLYTGQTPGTLENVVVKDIVPDDLIIDSLIITTPINHPKNETQLSDKSAFKISITEQLINVNEDTVIGGKSFSSQNEWEAYINATPLTYGISKDKKTVLVNLGNLPGSLRMADTEKEFKDKLTDNYIHFTEQEINALTNIYKISDSNPYPVYAFHVNLKVKSSNTDGIFSKNSYDNTAFLTANSGPETDATHTLNITQVGAGIQGSETKSVTLTKKDADSSALISGASFKLQYLNGNTWEDYTPYDGSAIRITDGNGQVKYTNIGSGTYRFVEVAAATGYDIESVIYSETQFIISSSSVTNYMITATNKKITQQDSTEESSSIPDETTSTEEISSTEGAPSSTPPSENQTTTQINETTTNTSETTRTSITGSVNNTGDTQNTYTWFIVAAISILVLAILLLTDKKSRAL